MRARRVGAARAQSLLDVRNEHKFQRRYEMSERNAVVAVYGTHLEAEGAVKELQRAGIDMQTLSIVGKDSHTDEHVVGYYNAGDRMKYRSEEHTSELQSLRHLVCRL